MPRKPKFKVGDIVKFKSNSNNTVKELILEVLDGKYKCQTLGTDMPFKDGEINKWSFHQQELEMELDPEYMCKLKFDKDLQKLLES